MSTICSKCGAEKTSTKCNFCGSEENLPSVSNDDVTLKLLAESEYKTGNYSSALQYYNQLYKKEPKNTSIIAYRSFCLYKLQLIQKKELTNYFSSLFYISSDTDLLKTIITQYSDSIKGSRIRSILELINAEIILKIFNNVELYHHLLKIIQNEIDNKNYIEIDFILFKSVFSQKKNINNDFYNDFINFILKNEILRANNHPSKLESEDYKITVDELVELISFSKNGYIPKSIFRYFFITQNNDKTLNDWQKILLNIKPEFSLIKAQIEEEVNNALNSIWYFKEGNKGGWKYVFTMETEEVKKKITSILKIGEKRANTNNCFIATATMGSNDHPVVLDLRIFRDNWLLDRKWGLAFTEYYYKYSPNAAKIIEKSYILRIASYLFIIKPLHFLIQRIR